MQSRRGDTRWGAKGRDACPAPRNATTGVKPMPRAQLVGAFEGAFKPGACPDVGAAPALPPAEATQLAAANGALRRALHRLLARA